MYGRVMTTEWLTPSMVRVILGGEGLDGYEPLQFTDAYLNVAIPPDEAGYSAPFDLAEVRESRPADEQPVRRRYTVRGFDPDEQLLTLDIVVHGDAGVGGTWAQHAKPGDALVFTGPGGGYRPEPAADWHLLAGDESALPAIARSLETISADAHAVVRLVCDGPDHQLDLHCPGKLDLVWLQRRGEPGDVDLLPAAIRELDFPSGRVHAFVHGEADEIRAIRRHLLAERGVQRTDLSCSPYWRRDMNDEAWRTIKGDYVAAMETDVQEMLTDAT